jgi:hypothetical protein
MPSARSNRTRRMRGGVAQNVPGALYKYADGNATSEKAAIKLAQAKVSALGGSSVAGFKTSTACNVSVPKNDCEEYGKQVFLINGNAAGGKRGRGRKTRGGSRQMVPGSKFPYSSANSEAAARKKAQAALNASGKKGWVTGETKCQNEEEEEGCEQFKVAYYEDGMNAGASRRRRSGRKSRSSRRRN